MFGMHELRADVCVACGADLAATYTVPEAMFRTGEMFRYRECSHCASLQINVVPHDLGRYYARSAYYSFNKPDPEVERPWVKFPLMRTALALNTRLFLATGIGRGPTWTRTARLAIDARILDLGCGDGYELKKLHTLGYSRLAGADPFLDGDGFAAPDVPLFARRHDEMTGTYDYVVMHHAFEHLADPHATLRSVRRLLAPGGRVVIRMPIKDCEAWDVYGVDWVQLDAPRHLVLYTRVGMIAILQSEGFFVEKIAYDSYGFQFWGSELVRRGEPHAQDPRKVFDQQQLEAWEQRSRELNDRGRGDSVLAVAAVND